MEQQHIYFTVQDVERKNVGYKTHTHTVTGTTNYKEEDFKKAVKHFKKRKYNDIIMHKVTILDDMPYAKDETSFGELVTIYKDGMTTNKLVFKALGTEYIL